MFQQVISSYLPITDDLREDASWEKWKTLFLESQIIGLHQWQKKKQKKWGVAEFTKFTLRSVQQNIKTKEDGGEPLSSQKKRGRITKTKSDWNISPNLDWMELDKIFISLLKYFVLWSELKVLQQDIIVCGNIAKFSKF